MTTKYQPLDFYNALIPVEAGSKSIDFHDKAKIAEMREFLKVNFGTEMVQNVDF